MKKIVNDCIDRKFSSSDIRHGGHNHKLGNGR